jgi:hypothetical protein
VTDAEPGETVAGGGILRFSRVATVAFAVAAVGAAAWPRTLARPVAVFDCALFLVGIGAFLVAYSRAIARSRTEQVEILGVYLLGGGAAPAPVRRALLGDLAVQVVVAVATAAIRPYTAVAFGVLVPMLGLGLAGLWGATHGTFSARAR